MRNIVDKIEIVSPLLERKLKLHPEWEVFLKKKKPSLPPLDSLSRKEVETSLRHFKYQQLLKILSLKITKRVPFKIIGEIWSDAAELCIERTYRWSIQELKKKFPSVSDLPFCILALGKLGSEELNISSDIDLLFLFREKDKESGPLADQMASLITEILSKITDEGFVFRVDNDLRPEGSKGPLTNSLTALEYYYQVHGQDWERQALIRARPVAGDIPLGEAFLKTMRPFIYRKHITLKDLAHLKSLREKMEIQIRKQRFQSENIKLGRGGIRELEFFVQALQSLHGGRSPSLRQTNTFEAIHNLEKEKIIPKKVSQSLLDAYDFLRSLENALQIGEDQQKHTLPQEKNDVEWKRLAIYLNLPDEKIVQKKLEQHQDIVHRYFETLFENDYEKVILKEALRTNTETAENAEEKFEGLAWFKKQENQRILNLIERSNISLPEMLHQLTLVAEVTLEEAYQFVSEEMKKKKTGPADSLVILGLGRLGSREMDYNSDLDILFLYFDPKDSSAEFYTQFARRFIATLSTPTRYGKAYEIDCDLRPSGRSGILVTSVKNFQNYYQKEAALWERFALAKARPISGPNPLCQKIDALLKNLVFANPLPQEAKREIRQLHQKTIQERAKEKEGKYNLKEGPGSTMFIEALIQFWQLQNGWQHPSLQRTNGFSLLKTLMDENIVSLEEGTCLWDSLLFFREIVSWNRLFSASSTSWMDCRSPLAQKVSQKMGFSEKTDIEKKIVEMRNRVIEIYEKNFS